VREVHEKLSEHKDAGYTTVLKQMQIMLEKGLLKRDASNRTHIFVAGVTQEDTQRSLLGKLLDTAFGGSAMKLVMQALGNGEASAEEREQIRKLLDDLDKK
jgi:predicted transcriptional regulator